MRSSELLSFLEETGDWVKLKERIAVPLVEYRKGLEIRGGSSPIDVRIEDKRVPLKATHLKKLCSAYLDGTLDTTEFSYISNALEICPDYLPESQKVEDAIHQLADVDQLKPLELREPIEFVLSPLESKNVQ